MGIPSLPELDALHGSICQAVGDPKRIQILYALYEEPRHVTALADLLEMPQPTVSRHLSLLKQRGLVLNEREGTTVVYRLADERIIEVLNIMRQILRDIVARKSGALEL